MSARAVGLGGAIESLPDIDSQFYSPGCLAFSKGISVNFQDINNLTAAESYPTGGNMTLGLAIATMKKSGLVYSGVPLAETSGSTLILSYGTKLSALPFYQKMNLLIISESAPLSRCFLSQSITVPGLLDQNGSGYDMDLGVYYKQSSWLSYAASAHNILPSNFLGGGTISWRGTSGDESIPSYFNAGASAKIIGDLRSPFYIENEELRLRWTLKTSPIKEWDTIWVLNSRI